MFQILFYEKEKHSKLEKKITYLTLSVYLKHVFPINYKIHLEWSL